MTGSRLCPSWADTRVRPHKRIHGGRMAKSRPRHASMLPPSARWIPIFFIPLLIALGCGGGGKSPNTFASFKPDSNVYSAVSPDFPQYKIRTIAVLPLEVKVDDPSIPSDAGLQLANFFYERLNTYDVYKVERPAGRVREGIEIELKKTFPLLPSLPKEGEMEGKPDSEEGSATAREVVEGGVEDVLRYDGVVTGVITRYKEREGISVAALNPASVQYDIYMVSLKDGKILWKATFNETQEALVDNLLEIGRFIRGGGGWQTRETLSKLGMERVVRTFPGIEGSSEKKD